MRIELSNTPVYLYFALALAGFAAGGASGSAAITAAAVAALVVASSQMLLRVGLGRACRTGARAGTGAASGPAPSHDVPRSTEDAPTVAKPTTAGPTTVSLETLFWSHIAAILLFALGAGLAIDAGFMKLQDPRRLAGLEPFHAGLAIAVVLAAIAAFSIPVPAPAKLRREAFAVVAAPMVAIMFVVLGDNWSFADGLAAVTIGLMLTWIAATTALEVRRLLVAADAGTIRPAMRPELAAPRASEAPPKLLALPPPSKNNRLDQPTRATALTASPATALVAEATPVSCMTGTVPVIVPPPSTRASAPSSS
jgi:hypothetical protein